MCLTVWCQIPTYQEYSLVGLPSLVVSDTYLPRIQSCWSTHPGCVRYLPTKNTVLSVYPPWLCQIPTYQEYSLVSLPTLVVSDTHLPRIRSCQSTHPGYVRYVPTKNTVLLVYPPWLCQIRTYQEYSLVSLPTLVVSDTYLPRIRSCQSTHPGCVRYLPTKNTVLLVYPPWLCQIPTYQEYSLVSLPTLVVSDTYLPRIRSCQSTHPGCVRYLPTKNTVLLVHPPWLCQIPTY